MIALGGTNGTGLIVGSGQTLLCSGPAFVLGALTLISPLILCTVTGIIA
jgi:amino acid permease